jgi:alkylresorcinol/alkylpyrone synthase
MGHIVGVGVAVPQFAVDQTVARDLSAQYFSAYLPHIERMASVFDHAAIEQRHFVVPPAWFANTERSLQERNDLYLSEAVALSEQAVQRALVAAGVTAQQVDNLIVVSSTGIATPSLDARLINVMNMRGNIRRTPIWGLGCAGGVTGLARAAELARAYPGSTTVIVAVETCSLTFQFGDTSKKNFIATALFADGAAAVVVTGDDLRTDGPEILDSQSTLWPDSLRVMGWDVVDTGFEVLFGVEIPRYIADLFRPEVDCFLGKHGLTIDQIDHLVFHPGGAKVLESYAQCLNVLNGHLEPSREILRRYGNMSSPTVLFVLDYILSYRHPQRGEFGLAAALGPGFSAEQVLLRF